MSNNITLDELRERMLGILSGNSNLDEIISLLNTNVMLPPENREYLSPDRTRPPPHELLNPRTPPPYSLTDPNPRPQVRPPPPPYSRIDPNPRPQGRPTPMRPVFRF